MKNREDIFVGVYALIVSNPRRVSRIITGTSRHRRGIRANSAGYCEFTRPRAERFRFAKFCDATSRRRRYIAFTSPTKGENFWKRERWRDGYSITREINEKGRSRIILRAAGYETLRHDDSFSERPWFSTRRWEILLNFRNTELDCLSESQALGS